MYGPALHVGCQGLAVAEDIGHRQWMAAGNFVLGAIYLDLLDAVTARPHLEHALALAETIGSRIWLGEVHALLASCCLAQHDLSGAESSLEATLGPTKSGPTASAELSLTARLGWYVRAELARSQGDPELALGIVDGLITSAPNVADRSRASIPRLCLVRGQALAQLGRIAEAEATLRWAIEDASNRGLQPIAWRSHLALGRLLRTQRRYEDAERMLVAAQQIVDHLAERIPDVDVRGSFLDRAAALFPARRPPTLRRAAKETYAGLTARERQVAALIAQGLSNRQIASELVVGEVTVASHVANILAKLGYSSRTQVASWATAKGLAPES
jgi:ATP/maltotriose-dependent transcriptional regulator MalT